MKIAIISTMQPSPWGGSEELWADMANQALEDSHQVVVSVYHWPTTPSKIVELQQKGAQIIRQPNPRFQRQPNRLARVFNKSLSLLRSLFHVSSNSLSTFDSLFRLKPDVVCISQGATYESIRLNHLLNLLYAASIPYVVICHMNRDTLIPDSTTRVTTTKFFAHAYRVAFVSDHNLKITERQLASKLSNAIILRNPVNLVEVARLPWPPSGSFNMASVARLQASFKGQDVLFEALGSELWQGRNWRLRLFGEGPDKEYLQELVRYYGIAEHVEFLGHVKDIRAIWSENHLLVLPSRAEGTPISLVEAMLCGRPSIVTDVGGNAEWVNEPQTGFIAEAPTANSFGAALERAWLARNTLEEIGVRAYDKALTLFDKTPGRSLLKITLDAAQSAV